MRFLLQLACIFALLAAQHGALTHAVWHLHEGLPAQAHAQDDHHDHARDDVDDGNSSQADLCGLHVLLGTVLGCAGAAGLQWHAPPVAAEGVLQDPHSRLGAEALPFFSRGPPPVLS
jgi:hypothetical protein